MTTMSLWYRIVALRAPHGLCETALYTGAGYAAFVGLWLLMLAGLFVFLGSEWGGVFW